ncbi:MAG: hypothetical protein JWP97_678 [Labilithrix sp.]|nr:hypothetical protein [Labilithrix sp.]
MNVHSVLWHAARGPAVTLALVAVLLAVIVLPGCSRPRGAPSAPPSAAPSADAVAPPAVASPIALWGITDADACAMPVSARGTARADAKPFARDDGTCRVPFCDVAEEPPAGADACFVAGTNLARAEQAIAGGVGTVRARASTPWDRKSPPTYLDRIDAHLHLADAEHAKLRAQGFVALDRHPYASYAVAFHDVFQQQLPVYVGVDAIFNAVYQATQTLLGDVEDHTLGPALARILDRLPVVLAGSVGRYDPETIADLEVYLSVASRLLHREAEVKPLRDPEREELVSSLTQSAAGASGLEPVELFGRERMIDFSQLAPRGHYANGGSENGFDWPPGPRGQYSATREHIAPSAYFQAMMWLSRLELNVVSRSCRSSQPGASSDPAETPREARDAIALADLVTRAGVLGELARFETVYGVFAGRREDLPLPALAALAARSGAGPRVPDAPARLTAAIGDGYARTARTHFMPEDATTLPVITTMFGPRIVPDIAPLTGLVHPSVPGRYLAGAADVGYLLGHDRAKSYLGKDLESHPALQKALDEGRASLAAATKAKRDVYASWLAATLRLADAPAGVVPSFMRTDAYADQRLGSALAAYAQIRHTFVLLAGQGYDGYGCEIPDGYVEPALTAYDALLGWVSAAQAAVPSEAKYFQRVTTVLSTLRAIVRAELSGAPLSEPQRRWLGMVAEYTPTGGSGGDSGAVPKYTGWYFDLFPDREIGAQRNVALVADFLTLTNAERVAHVGIANAALGVFVVDVNGEPRAMVGPVASTYEVATPIAERLDDERATTAPGKQAPWQSSYLVPAPAEPDVAARLFTCADGARVLVQSAEPLEVAVTLLDHHGDALGAPVSAAGTSTPRAIVVTLPASGGPGPRALVEGVHLAVKRRSTGGAAAARWDLVSGPSVYAAEIYGSGGLPSSSTSRFPMGFGTLRAGAR